MRNNFLFKTLTLASLGLFVSSCGDSKFLGGSVSLSSLKINTGCSSLTNSNCTGPSLKALETKGVASSFYSLLYNATCEEVKQSLQDNSLDALASAVGTVSCTTDTVPDPDVITCQSTTPASVEISTDNVFKNTNSYTILTYIDFDNNGFSVNDVVECKESVSVTEGAELDLEIEVENDEDVLPATVEGGSLGVMYRCDREDNVLCRLEFNAKYVYGSITRQFKTCAAFKEALMDAIETEEEFEINSLGDSNNLTNCGIQKGSSGTVCFSNLNGFYAQSPVATSKGGPSNPLFVGDALVIGFADMDGPTADRTGEGPQYPTMGDVTFCKEVTIQESTPVKEKSKKGLPVLGEINSSFDSESGNALNIYPDYTPVAYINYQFSCTSAEDPGCYYNVSTRGFINYVEVYGDNPETVDVESVSCNDLFAAKGPVAPQPLYTTNSVNYTGNESELTMYTSRLYPYSTPTQTKVVSDYGFLPVGDYTVYGSYTYFVPSKGITSTIHFCESANLTATTLTQSTGIFSLPR